MMVMTSKSFEWTFIKKPLRKYYYEQPGAKMPQSNVLIRSKRTS
jgi:hypothetical protein